MRDELTARKWLEPIAGDEYFPADFVPKGTALLLELAERIEREKPKGEAVFALTHATVEAFNVLGEEVDIETVAREAIAEDIGFILDTYGYEVDLESDRQSRLVIAVHVALTSRSMSEAFGRRTQLLRELDVRREVVLPVFFVGPPGHRLRRLHESGYPPTSVQLHSASVDQR